jgi:hypothetical protein
MENQSYLDEMKKADEKINELKDENSRLILALAKTNQRESIMPDQSEEFVECFTEDTIKVSTLEPVEPPIEERLASAARNSITLQGEELHAPSARKSSNVVWFPRFNKKVSMYYGINEASILNFPTPPSSTSPSQQTIKNILEVFHAYQSSIFNLFERIHSHEDDSSIFESLKTVLHSCRSITHEIDSYGSVIDQRLFDDAKKAFSEALEELVLQTRTLVSVKNNLSVEELEATSRLLTRIVIELIELVYGADVLEPVQVADEQMNEYSLATTNLLNAAGYDLR